MPATTFHFRAMTSDGKLRTGAIAEQAVHHRRAKRPVSHIRSGAHLDAGHDGELARVAQRPGRGRVDGEGIRSRPAGDVDHDGRDRTEKENAAPAVTSACHSASP